jgi:hypothetical protein
MSCPGFGERDAALRQMMGPPTAQEHLRESMRRDLDPRWHLLPVEPVEPPSYGIPWWPLAVVAAVVLLVFTALSI